MKAVVKETLLNKYDYDISSEHIQCVQLVYLLSFVRAMVMWDTMDRNTVNQTD